MKKIIAFIIVLFLPVIVLAQDVGIKSINLVEKGDFVEVVKEPTYEGLNINFDLKFNNVGDSATYKVVLENKDEENYFVNLKADSDSKYILYTLDSDLDTNIVKAKSTTSIYVIVKYANEVPSYKLTNNKYSETNNVKISLTNNKGEEVITDSATKNAAIVVNPNTGNIVLRIRNSNIVISLYTVGIVLLIAIIAIIVLKKLKVKKYLSMMLILGMILIPGISMALKEITLTINSKIEIEPKVLKTFKVRKLNKEAGKFDKAVTYTYEEGMTLSDWLESKYNIDKLSISSKEEMDSFRNSFTNQNDNEEICENFDSLIPIDLVGNIPLIVIEEAFLRESGMELDFVYEEYNQIVEYELSEESIVLYANSRSCLKNVFGPINDLSGIV